LRCAILTLFPAALRPYLDESILGIAQAQGNLRVDDRPFGGGPGMVLKPEPIFAAVEDLERAHGAFHKVLLCPRGRTFDQRKARELSRSERLLFLCGRYEGYDERIRQGFAWEEISLGDFVLAGGELAAMVVLESPASSVAPSRRNSSRSKANCSTTRSTRDRASSAAWRRPTS
jgi:tRNA (guanine37-N1)-methyltransferase